MSIIKETIPYGGWQACLRIKNSLIELIIPHSVGIRVISFSFVDGSNIFAEFHEQMGLSGGDTWRIYGGHRLWHAPETRERTYSNDNHPIGIEHHGDMVRLVQPRDHANIRKEIDIHLAPNKAEVTLVHRLTNMGVWEVQLAPWALSVMSAGGKAIIPLPPRGSHETDLLPNTSLTLWSYSHMNDPRWTWGSEYIILRQDPTIIEPQKMGLTNTHGWAAYYKHGTLFVKRTAYHPHATYPDNNSNYEFFMNNTMLEVESLAPLTTLAPHHSVEHTETWSLFRDVPEPNSEADILREILPLVAK
jgi:hypothetical protein